MSHETIYRSLFVQAKGALKHELTAYLRTRRVMRRPRGANKYRRRRCSVRHPGFVDHGEIQMGSADTGESGDPGREAASGRVSDVGVPSKAGTKQHRVPAALVGRFGRRKPGRPWREATVLVTNLRDGSSVPRRADKVAWDVGAFDYSDNVRSVDPLWTDVEQELGTAVDWARRTLSPTMPTLNVAHANRYLMVLRMYIADITLRSPDFDRACQASGMPVDETQELRRRLIHERRAEYSSGDLDLEVLVRQDESAGSLMVNDLGYVQLAGAEDGFLVPLARDLAAFLRLGRTVLDNASVGFGWLDPHIAEARRAMHAASAAPGGHGPRWVYSHPDDPPPRLI